MTWGHNRTYRKERGIVCLYDKNRRVSAVQGSPAVAGNSAVRHHPVSQERVAVESRG